MTVYLHKNLLRQLDMIETTGASQQLSGQIVGGKRALREQIIRSTIKQVEEYREYRSQGLYEVDSPVDGDLIARMTRGRK